MTPARLCDIFISGKGKEANMPEALREQRKLLGLTQEALAKQVGKHRAHIAAIERGEVEPRVRLAIRIARELDSTVEELWRS